MTTALTQSLYVVAAVLFIVGLKRMSHPRTALQGNLLGVAGMTLAIVVALFQQDDYWSVAIGLLIGAIVGIGIATRVKLTDMPQMVALFNGFGGAASVLVAAAALLHGKAETVDSRTAIGVAGIIGAITFWGSLVAFGKLQELELFKQPIEFPHKQLANVITAVAMLVLAILLAVLDPFWGWVFVPIVLLASVIGVLIVNPIGEADMPVVIALLNSYSGLAAAATGFVITNHVLVIGGSLVGAAGIILTRLMCKTMNRSLTNVLFGSMDGKEYSTEDGIYDNLQITTAENVALMLEAAQRVVFVPGYGMAVAQAQHAARNLAKLLEAQQITVEYAIHPVAGRMHGHMNVLLAEADVPYDQLIEMDRINPMMDNVDVAIVLGANDVVNPVARTDPHSPIGGMSIIDVDKARIVIVIKRSLSPGFANIPNPLFAEPNTWMLFGDAEQAVLDITTAFSDA